MAMTRSGAERQRAYRQRQAEENARLRAEIGAGFFNAADSQKAAPRRPLPEDPELARLVAEAREIDRRYTEELGRRVRQLSDEELGQFVSYLMRTRKPDDDDEEAEDE
jgi:hypothetical protein